MKELVTARPSFYRKMRERRELLDGDRFGEIARLVDVASETHRDCVRQQL